MVYLAVILDAWSPAGRRLVHRRSHPSRAVVDALQMAASAAPGSGWHRPGRVSGRVSSWRPAIWTDCMDERRDRTPGHSTGAQSVDSQDRELLIRRFWVRIPGGARRKPRSRRIFPTRRRVLVCHGEGDTPPATPRRDTGGDPPKGPVGEAAVAVRLRRPTRGRMSSPPPHVRAAMTFESDSSIYSPRTRDTDARQQPREGVWARRWPSSINLSAARSRSRGQIGSSSPVRAAAGWAWWELW